MDENQETIQEVKTNSNSFNPLVIVGIIAVVAIGGFVFMSGKGTDSMKNDESIEPSQAAGIQTAPDVQTVPDATAAGGMEEQTITIEAGGFYYKPAEIRIKKGQKVKIVMNSVDMMHDFNIDELEVKMPIVKSGETGTVEFTPDTVGTFEYYCSVGQHREKGQVGTLIVE